MNKHLAPLLFIAGFLYILPGYDKYWRPYDEGFILEASRMITKGMVPYRDFFILMYPPGQIYTLAALLKVFGMTLIAPRIYTIIMQAVISVSIFCIVKRFAKTAYAMIAFIIYLAAVAAGGEPIPRPIWPGIAFSLLATISFIDFIEKGEYRWLLLSGVLVGLAVIFKHDIGFLTFGSGFIGLLVYSIFRAEQDRLDAVETITHVFRMWGLFTLFPFLFVGGLAIWLHKSGAFGDAVRSLLIFPREFCEKCVIAFPKFCFDLRMIFHRDCLFIENNRFYIPFLIYAIAAVFILRWVISRKRLDKRTVSLTALLLLGVSYLQQVIVRSDPGHLTMAFPPAAILFGIMLGYRTEFKNSRLKAAADITLAFASVLMALFVFKNTEIYFKEVYSNAYLKKNMAKVVFRQGALYVPDDGRDMTVSLMDYIEKNTASDEKIYIGSLRHMAPQYGWYELVYFLTERLPAVKYYEIHPGLQDKIEIQEEMVKSLKQNRARVLLLRDFGDTAVLGPLDKYIREEYILDKIIGTYHIYVKR